MSDLSNFNPLHFWVQEIAAKREKIESDRLALEAAKQASMAKRAALMLNDYQGIYEAFRSVFTPQEWMVTYGYSQRGNTFAHPISKTGNYSCGVYTDETGVLRAHALSTNDPLYIAGNKSGHDAFSVFCTLQYGGDKDAALKDAGDNLLTIDSVSYNKAQQIEWGKQQEQAKKEQSKNADWSGDIDALFNDIVLTQEHVDKMANTHFLIPNIIAQGHVTVYAAPANGGKSALFRYFCEKLSKDGMKVIYVNVDAGPGDLKKHYAHAKEHNYRVIAPDACEGKSADDVTEQLRTIADGSAQCGEYVFILDTLKKFTDVINKTKAKEFYKLLRKLTVKGATICLLGHCNKYKDEEGRHIYEGTADLRNDIDNLIYLDSFLNEQTNILEVTTRPDKVRAEFHPVSFNIDRNNGLKVTPANKIINILPDEDREIIELAKWAITEGNESQGDIVEYIKEKLEGVGDKKIKKKLKFYSAGPRAELKATNTGLGRGLKYEVVY